MTRDALTKTKETIMKNKLKIASWISSMVYGAAFYYLYMDTPHCFSSCVWLVVLSFVYAAVFAAIKVVEHESKKENKNENI
jgi:hypothetical protein